MRKMYHIASDWTKEMASVLEKHGISISPDGSYQALEIEQLDYKKLKPHFENWGISGIPYPEFTEKELRESTISAKMNSHLHGYPMPSKDFGYLDLTYDLKDYCDTCGIGKKQKDSFRLTSVPKQGKKRCFKVNWVHDELFVDIELYNNVFQPLGIKKRSVVQYKKEIPFQKTVQLVMEEAAETLRLNDEHAEKCDLCGRLKYPPMPMDFYPKYNEPTAAIFKSMEYFGTGGEARKRIFVRKDLREKLIEMKIDREDWYIPTQ